MLKDFFYLQRTDRIFLILFIAIASGIAAAVFFMGKEQQTVQTTVLATSQTTQQQSAASESPAQHAERFPFDPNTADSNTLRRLGLSPRIIRNIYRYRQAGGVFGKTSDFARLYGLTKKQYRELEPYIRIADDYTPASEWVEQQKDNQQQWHSTDPLPFPHQPKLNAGEHIALNEADTNALKTVPGIGSYFAKKIMNYRKRLGGFHSVEQLMEIEHFPEEAIPYFTIVSSHTVRINLNTATLQQMMQHPYISFYQARDITEYRRLRGKINSLSDLSTLKSFNENSLRRLAPYTAF